MILFCHLLDDASGSPRVLAGTIRALVRDGDRLLLGTGGGGGPLGAAPIEIERYAYERGAGRWRTLIAYLASQWRLWRALRRERDVPRDAAVFVNTLLPFAGALWGRMTGRRVVVHVHEVSVSPAPLRALLTGIAGRCADILIYVSEDHRRRLPIRGPEAVVIPNAIDPDLAERGRAAAWTPRRSGRFEVLMLASPRDFKGVPEFLECARRMEARGDVGFRLVLNGDAEETGRYLSGRDLPGNVAIESRTLDPARFYELADVVVNLSRPDEWVETFGLTLVEAMAFGVPVIAPVVGGPTEIVRPGRDGWLVDGRDAAALDAAILSLADDPERAGEMSVAARARARDYTFEAYRARLAAVVAPRRGAGAP